MCRTVLLVNFLTLTALSAPAPLRSQNDDGKSAGSNLVVSNGLVQLSFGDASSGFALSVVRGSGSGNVSLPWLHALVCMTLFGIPVESLLECCASVDMFM